ncbi:hypothetical protein L1987_36330 [Smallanthus sonchifolius]|uniref:Uncharacterized protein n=1 Tax=Smallanthus sonchifolius TaxID=185202 RepID=A0ACB9HD52_9ASTR|nr:hypothetical protein L1987_36330 [Smallanthus sonchifolius]
MATAGTRWGVVMSCDAGFSKQVVELDFLYPSEGIHRRWDNGYCITSVAATLDQTALILSVPRRKPGAQDTLRTSQFPSTQVKEKWAKHLYLACICYGRTEFTKEAIEDITAPPLDDQLREYKAKAVDITKSIDAKVAEAGCYTEKAARLKRTSGRNTIPG